MTESDNLYQQHAITVLVGCGDDWVKHENGRGVLLENVKAFPEEGLGRTVPTASAYPEVGSVL